MELSLVSKLSALVDPCDLKALEKITDDFLHKRIVGKDGPFKGSHKAFVYKGDIPRREMIAVKRLIGVEMHVEKFKKEAERFTSLDEKNIERSPDTTTTNLEDIDWYSSKENNGSAMNICTTEALVTILLVHGTLLPTSKFHGRWGTHQRRSISRLDAAATAFNRFDDSVAASARIGVW